MGNYCTTLTVNERLQNGDFPKPLLHWNMLEIPARPLRTLRSGFHKFTCATKHRIKAAMETLTHFALLSFLSFRTWKQGVKVRECECVCVRVDVWYIMRHAYIYIYYIIYICIYVLSCSGLHATCICLHMYPMCMRACSPLTDFQDFLLAFRPLPMVKYSMHDLSPNFK